jgi:polysaccharide pyruvyl transferase WcaK-like protein
VRRGPGRPPRIGLFGLLGSGNIGNDISMQSVLAYLRTSRPDATIDAMCMGPERVKSDAGIDAIHLQWSRQHEDRVSGLPAKVLKAAGKGIDALRTAAWVRRHDVVIVPGMGILEASTPINPWGVPYALFLLCASGRIFSTRVALVSVGATVISQRSVRWISTSAARLAYYRSYRDARSRDAMRQRGLDVSGDRVFPDLVFAIPPEFAGPGDRQTVGVGVMAYYGTNDDGERADDIHASYTVNMTRFVQWLLDNGRNVLLFVGDTSDTETVADIFAALRMSHPGMAPGRVVAERITSFADLMRAMAPASSVVATRYHNVMCALKLGKPAISLGYSGKNISLMEDMGLPEYCQHANDISFDLLLEQFAKLEKEAGQIRLILAERNAELSAKLAAQFTLLDSVLFAGSDRGD